MTGLRLRAVAFAAAFATPATIGLIGFLTLIDLFGTQAIVPQVAERYGVAPADAGLAINACTFGMAAASLALVFLARRIPRRTGVAASLALLAAPTLALAFAPDLATFLGLRMVQGAGMATAFTLTMAYLAERCTAAQSATALAAYITGAVASNLVGRLLAAGIASGYGLAFNFVAFAALNLCGAALAFVVLGRAAPMSAAAGDPPRSALAAVRDHLANPCLRTSFVIGFSILFAFVGVFTYVNFVLAAPPIGLAPAALGLVYLVFTPAMLTTPFAGHIARRYGARRSFIASLGLSVASLPLLLMPNLPVMLVGLAALGAGTFFAQATATGFVGRAAISDRAAASALYLTAYYLGGLVGAALLGRLFDRFGWGASLIAAGLALTFAAALAARLKASTAEPAAAASGAA